MKDDSIQKAVHDVRACVQAAFAPRRRCTNAKQRLLASVIREVRECVFDRVLVTLYFALSRFLHVVACDAQCSIHEDVQRC